MNKNFIPVSKTVASGSQKAKIRRAKRLQDQRDAKNASVFFKKFRKENPPNEETVAQGKYFIFKTNYKCHYLALFENCFVVLAFPSESCDLEPPAAVGNSQQLDDSTDDETEENLPTKSTEDACGMIVLIKELIVIGIQ